MTPSTTTAPAVPASSARAASGSQEQGSDVGRLLIQCADQPGLVAAVSDFLYRQNANITHLDQHSTDPQDGVFFQRTVFHLDGLAARWEDLEAAFASEVAARFPDMRWRFSATAKRRRVAIMVSKLDHCLLDLIWRSRRDELPIDIVMVIGNHPDLADTVRPFGVPFVHVPVTKETKAEAEARHLELLRGNVDLVVLARYMQIVSGDFLERVGVPTINIHHSFLPAFIGAGPYEKARSRGVKLVGATAHYVTEDLDEGPIIEQDVVRVSHQDSVEDLARRGADVERTVLSRAVRWHCEDRVARHGNTTVVFS
ncbi:formyltetrahydrofolate deformylase [Lipingzhangella halophila]|uniref:Formyltetrahydrofolate deformylase n=1 Tax=Lipingzhangella halophila TaxID=1783352 RepID=A0A7W7RK31_9ACTN|nr:formyltetrahydrofolate deformylase [Lipingzhangella halophila]MBB4933008.1 formyltetrahydrofolate deformylase [Lipingzhangella halophila]